MRVFESFVDREHYAVVECVHEFLSTCLVAQRRCLELKSRPRLVTSARDSRAMIFHLFATYLNGQLCTYADRDETIHAVASDNVLWILATVRAWHRAYTVDGVRPVTLPTLLALLRFLSHRVPSFRLPEFGPITVSLAHDTARVTVDAIESELVALSVTG